MAGRHQIWRMRTADASGIGVYAGNGCEDIVDGRNRAAAALANRFRLVRPAQRTGYRRPVALRGRQRRQFDPSRPVGGQDRTCEPSWARPTSRRPGSSPSATSTAAARASGCSIRWAHLLRGQALRGRHLQQQDQGDRPGHRRDATSGRQRGAPAEPTPRPPSTSRAESPPPAASSTWPTPTTT